MANNNQQLNNENTQQQHKGSKMPEKNGEFYMNKEKPAEQKNMEQNRNVQDRKYQEEDAPADETDTRISHQNLH